MTKARKNKPPHARRVEELPEPARSIAREILPHMREDAAGTENPETQAAEQGEEWAASRAPAARPKVPSESDASPKKPADARRA